jgi:hypothetical protein
LGEGQGKAEELARNAHLDTSGEFFTLRNFSRVIAFLLLRRCSCKRELDGADCFTFEEFGVGSEAKGFQ